MVSEVASGPGWPDSESRGGGGGGGHSKGSSSGTGTGTGTVTGTGTGPSSTKASAAASNAPTNAAANGTSAAAARHYEHPSDATAARSKVSAPHVDVRNHYDRVAPGTIREGGSHGEVDDDDDNQLADDDSQDETTEMGIRAVNEIISAIGMGNYQWKLFYLCGFGWLADNMWLQGISVIIPQIQKQFDVPDAWSGLGTSSAFIGMIIGSSFWGPVSDIIGRKPAFTMTLLICSGFGFAAAFAPTFRLFCLMLMGMGIGVGGNLPVDGSLFLEFVPQSHQNLLTLLSLFWPAGQLVASIFAWYLLVGGDPAVNTGWRYVLGALSLTTLGMLIARRLTFDMLESPKYLVSVGKFDEAFAVLRKLAVENNRGSAVGVGTGGFAYVEVASGESGVDTEAGSRGPVGDFVARMRNTPRATDASATGPRAIQPSANPNIGRLQRSMEGFVKGVRVFKRRFEILVAPNMLRTSVLIWCIWSLISVGYTMFNGFLPKFLGSLPDSDEPPPTDYETYRNYFIVSIMGIPGSFAGMYLIETTLGRRGTMAATAAGTAAALFLFTLTRTQTGQLIASCIAAVLQNAMYGVLYCYTPEVFDSQVRGTANGIAAALSRVFGTTAPIITGTLLGVSLRLPLYVSSGLIASAAVCMILLPIETRGRTAM
ncbi:major facilitator superfamily domain-containing protein [Zopfochytrium polystomum]|nr:major facilitator superfamily domain-containing protein [Zopfochytrium polystomum]